MQALLVDHGENYIHRTDATLDHQSHERSQIGGIALNGRETSGADLQTSLWEKLALEAVQEHGAHPRHGVNPHERELQPELARTHCL